MSKLCGEGLVYKRYGHRKFCLNSPGEYDFLLFTLGFEGNFRLPFIDDLDILGEEFCYGSIMMYGRYVN